MRNIFSDGEAQYIQKQFMLNDLIMIVKFQKSEQKQCMSITENLMMNEIVTQNVHKPWNAIMLTMMNSTVMGKTTK